jgi:hypothetical protein
MDLPSGGAKPARTLLDDALDGTGRTAKEVGTRKEIQVQGHPGLETEFAPQGGHMWYRVVLVGNRLYQVGVVAHSAAKSDYAPRAERFFGSFGVTAR